MVAYHLERLVGHLGLAHFPHPLANLGPASRAGTRGGGGSASAGGSFGWVFSGRERDVRRSGNDVFGRGRAPPAALGGGGLGAHQGRPLGLCGVLLLMVPRVRSRRRRSKCCARAARGDFLQAHQVIRRGCHVSWNRRLVREPPEIPSDAGGQVSRSAGPHSASRGAMALCARSPFEAIGRTVYRWPLLVYFASLLVPVALTVAVVRAPARNRVPPSPVERVGRSASSAPAPPAHLRVRPRVIISRGSSDLRGSRLPRRILSAPIRRRARHRHPLLPC